MDQRQWQRLKALSNSLPDCSSICRNAELLPDESAAAAVEAVKGNIKILISRGLV
jgi:hypothetical protein